MTREPERTVDLRPGNSRYVIVFGLIFGAGAWSMYDKQGASGAFWTLMAPTVYTVVRSALAFATRLRLRATPDGALVLERRIAGISSWREDQRLIDARGATVSVVEGDKDMWPSLRIDAQGRSICWVSERGYVGRDQRRIATLLEL